MILEKFTIHSDGIVLNFDKSFTKMTAVVHTTEAEQVPVLSGCFCLKKETIIVNYTIPKKILFIPTSGDSIYIKVEIMEIDSQNCRNNNLAYLFCTRESQTENEEPAIKSDLLGTSLMSEGMVTLLQRGFS